MRRRAVKQPIAGLLICLILIVGCGGSRPEPALDATADAEAPGPVEPRIEVPEGASYVIGVGDVLRIDFFYYPQYNVDATVRPDGVVSIPLVGEIMARGMKPSEVEDIIRARYAQVVAEPEVTVMVIEFADQTVFVFGQVEKPGAYPLSGRMTLLDAVAGAGGIRETGKSGSVILMRRTGTGEYIGRRVDLKATLAAETAATIPLEARDVVYVPMTTIAKVDVFVDQFFRQLSPGWLFYLYGHQALTREGRFVIGE
jgi:protein involved in polysaccharide export with SLBB domain